MDMNRRQVTLLLAGGVSVLADGKRADRVGVVRVPNGGIQPQSAVDDEGVLHLAFYTGEARGGDIFYVRSGDRGATFSKPLRVNSQPGSAIAAGTIRGAQIAVGRNGRVHVAWNGSDQAEPKGPVNPDSGKPGAPMLYTRLNDAGSGFEAQRNLMQHSFGLDGGGSVAADGAGNVYVAWHGIGGHDPDSGGKQGEARRRVWIARSEDDGRSFAAETKAWSAATGACGCCGMKLFADRAGTLHGLYRSATDNIHRDIYVLTSKDRGRSFEGRLLHKWDINACPMSSMDIATNGAQTVGAWETGGQVYWSPLDRWTGIPVAAPGDGKGRKHPRIAVNRDGQVLLAWTEGTGWQKGGSLAWQVFDSAGRPTGDNGRLPGVPVWSFASAAAWPAGRFLILY